MLRRLPAALPFVTRRCFITLASIVVVFVLGYFFQPLYYAGLILLGLVAGLMIVDAILLYRVREGITAERVMAERLSNGDENTVEIRLESRYALPLNATILDETPAQFQHRQARHDVRLAPRDYRVLTYSLRPTQRGTYAFGVTNVFVTTTIGLLERRYRCGNEHEAAVFPSILQMQKYAFVNVTNRLDEAGLRRIRRLGHTLEFDHIREYVRGDDYRTINWKAFARAGTLMVNQHRDERAQPVYCLIDRGRAMRMPFDGLTLLDYAVNTSLVMADTTIRRQDRAGLLVFGGGLPEAFVDASRKPGHLPRLMQALYRIDTEFGETDFARLQAAVSRRIPRRSLLILFTNFESVTAMRRQLSYLRALSARHVLVVAMFENTELTGFLRRPAERLTEVYEKTIAEGFVYEKREIELELQRHGIHTILTPPSRLTVGALNKYFELKSMGAV